MKKFSFLLVIIFSLSAITAKAEKPDSSIVCSVIKHGLNDTKDIVLSPLKWNYKEWLLFGGISASTTALILYGDQPVYDYSNTLHTKTTDIIAMGIQPMGNYYPIAAIVGFFSYGYFTKDNYALETSLIAAESLFLTTCMVQSVKYLAGRVRPNDNGTTYPDDWRGPFKGERSFYSGHTSTAFSVASVFAYRYRDETWVPIVCYSLATLGGLERIFDNRHWASDVLFGAAVGTASGIFLCKSWEKSKIKFFPSVSTDHAMLSLIIPLSE